MLNASAPTTNGVGLPIPPFAFENEIVPLQDGAAAGWPPVAPDAEAATFTTVMEAVSLLPRPTGGNTNRA